MKIWKILSLSILQKNKNKNEKAYTEENTKGIAEQSFDKEIMGELMDLISCFNSTRNRNGIIPAERLPI